MQDKYRDQIHEDYPEQEIHLRDYLQVLQKRKTIILTVLGLVFLVTVVKTFTATPIFTASSQVLLERNQGNKGLDYQNFRYEPEFLDTQAEIIKSANVARKVVENSQLATKYRHYFFTEDKNPSFLLSITKSVKDGISNIISMVAAPEEGTGDREGGLNVAVEPKTDEEIITSIVQAGLGVKPLNNTKIVSISYQDKSPAMAKLVADAVVQAYMDEMLEIRLSTSSYSVKWMTDKAREEREKLEYTERELQKFMRENDLVTVENKLTVLPQKLSEFGSQLSKTEAAKKELQDLLDQIKLADNNLDKLEKIPNFATNEVLKNIRERAYKANQNIQELSKKYGPKHPKMIKANDELRILNEEKRFEIDRIVSSITNSYELAASKERSMRELLASTKSEMLNLNEKFMQYSIMKRDVDSNRVMYETLQTGIKTEGVTEQSQSVNIWVIKKADLPIGPSKPNKKRNLLLGLILGLFGGVGLAFFIEYLDNTIKNSQDLEDKFGLTVLGSIEEVSQKEDNIETFIVKNPLSPLAESYRLIRSGLLLSSAEQPPRAMLITSMDAKEGKTSTTANIARILAQGDKKVLIVDCDLRRPRMHTLLNMSNAVGLSMFLSGATEQNILLKVPDENLTLIPAGPIPPNPAELLSSKKMQLLVEKMAEKFDFVLLDSPPVQSVTDSLALSQIVDGTIVVVRAGKTTNEMLESGMKKMRDVQTHFLGFVINGLKGKDIGKSYYGYSTYYAKDDD